MNYNMNQKKFGIGKLIGWIVFLIAVAILVLMYRNDMNFEVTVQQILGFVRLR